ncbi:MAG: hydantoinase B/oxoprolinase family protein [Solirubrobacterales bacterium]|nr:hydantoinase B/oxoprolinase family protein [Solirubrobacterales bacterium]
MAEGSGPPNGPGRPEHSEPDPIEVRITAGAVASACEEMGAVLIRSAHSANIKERRDCSAAIFNPAGEMVMQAEHIPVHLGSMPASVRAIVDKPHVPGVSWFLNDPYSGGTHLPDITVVTPAFAEGRLIGFAANRAHHADVGGVLPGSMPADSTTIDDEGVIIPPRILDDESILEVVTLMRQPEQRRADLRAQLAANRTGIARLQAMAATRGADALEGAMNDLISYAERRTRTEIERIPDGSYRASDVLEARSGDIGLRLEVTVAGDRIRFDFTGTSGPDQGNLNCPRSVTESACLFAIRVLTDPDIPSSAGAWRPVEVVVPEGCLLSAVSPSAVVAGNVETSSRVADLCLSAFGLAQGQGTMNNLTLGSDSFTYYETLGGGQAASLEADGPSAVHVAMSNTLNTPIEAMEAEFPLRTGEYSIRRGSGGKGRHDGGDGLVREIVATEPMDFALLTERRRHAPAGADGGDPGQPGRNLKIREDGSREDLEPKSTGRLDPGDRLRIETPGGGGYGSP